MLEHRPRWEVAWDGKIGRYYYFDRVTGSSTWTRPNNCPREVQFPKEKPKKDNLISPDENRVPPKPQIVPEGWEAIYDPKEERYFYYNAENQERTWYKPTRTRSIVDTFMQESAANAATRQMTQMSKLSEASKAQSKPAPKKKEKHDFMANMWDAKTFAKRIREFQQDGEGMTVNVAVGCALSEVKNSNDDYAKIKKVTVPQTEFVPYHTCIHSLKHDAERSWNYRLDPAVSISRRTTASGITFFAQDPRRIVCALNFASGYADRVGGEYAVPYGPKSTGIPNNDNQEEDLCRRAGSLYASLDGARKEEYYPFGPSTCKDVTKANRYRDVLFTPYTHKSDDGDERLGLQITRGTMEEGFPQLPAEKTRRCCVVSAAPPCIPAGEIFDKKLVFETITSIFVAPILKEPRCTTLILGAWGCGSRYRNDATRMAQLFAQAIVRTLPELDICLGKLYHEIHFAIPGDHGTENYEIFKSALETCGIHVEEYA